MKMSKLAKVADSVNKSRSVKAAHSVNRLKIADAIKRRKTHLLRKVKDSLSETTTTDEAIDAVVALLDTEDPVEVLEATVSAMAEIVESLEDRLAGGYDPEEGTGDEGTGDEDPDE